MIMTLAGQGYQVECCCNMFGVSVSGYYDSLNRPPSARALRRAWITPLIADVHKASQGTYGALRITAELRLGHGTVIGHCAVSSIMKELGIQGLPTRKPFRRPQINLARSVDLVRRDFHRDTPDRLWMTDIERHEALSDRAVMKGHRCQFVAAGW